MDNQHEVSAELLVKKEQAESLPRNPEGLQECIRAAADTMNDLAAERGRRICERPRFVDAKDTGLGYVKLEFRANTVVR